MIPNFPVLFATAFIPFFIAYAWYHPSLFGGDHWTKIAGLTEAQAKNPVKAGKLGLSILLNFLLAFGIYNLAVHASGVFGMVSADTEALKTGTAAAFLAEYGSRHLTMGHGVIHGIFQGVLCFVIPIVGYVVIFERKSTKYLLVTGGFWLISMAVMGAVICKWGWTYV